MLSWTESWRKLVHRVQPPPEWGIEPVPAANRVLGFLDYFVLWGDLGIGLLVILTGSFLVPGLGLPAVLVVTLAGSALGCLLLALIGVVGSDNAIPTMVLLRPVLGRRGSYLPSALNVLQLIGWTVFEFLIMGYAADAIGRILFGFSSLPLWTAVFAALVVLMGLGGPVGVVREWLEKFAVWVAIGTAIWLTWHLLSTANLAALWRQPGDGSLTVGLGIDLVIAQPISWLPLVADYNRFARRSRDAFWGTFAGNILTNVWFYLLGALVMLSASVAQEPKSFVSAIALSAGWVILLILLADETHNAWADLYSAAVSIQNVLPKARQRWLIPGLGAVSFLIAVALDITRFENFLFLIGSFFIPLFGILVGDYFVLRRRRYALSEFYAEDEPRRRLGSVNLVGIIAWVVGILVYHVTNPVTLRAFFPTWAASFPGWTTAFGGSLPSFITTLAVYVVLAGLFARRRASPASP
jgi:NCS1 family nucleobase:cation symporter-1